MKILLISAAMYVICHLIGVMLLPIKGSVTSVVKRFSAHIGYAYLLVSFYVLYVVFKTTSVAVVTALLIPFVFFLFRRLIAKKGSTIPKEVINNSITDRWSGRYLIAIVSAVYILAAWPYLVTGFGNYWHSGNLDMEDGLNGRDAYINEQIFDTQTFSLAQITGDSAWTDFGTKSGALAPKAKDRENDSYFAWYAGDGYRLQYSNLAFWSFLFGETHGLDIVILNALINLVLMAVGIFYFAQLAFQLNNRWSAIAAFSSVTASFYLGSYWNGHIGSLMYGALVPMLFCFMLLTKERDQWKENIPWLLLVIAALALTYPEALALGLAYLAGYRIYSSKQLVDVFGYVKNKLRHRRILTILFGLLLLASFSLLIYGLWEFTDSYRVRQASQYRAAGLVHDPGILPVFLGFIPSTAGLANYYYYLALVTIGAISAFIALIWVLKHSGLPLRRSPSAQGGGKKLLS